MTHAGRPVGELLHAAQIVAVDLLRLLVILDLRRGQNTLLDHIGLMQEIGLVVTRTRRDEHRHGHTRYGGMDARVVEQSPYYHRRHHIGEHTLFAHAVHVVDGNHYQHGYAQQRHVRSLAVEESYDKYGTKIVGDGERRKEHLQRYGHTVAQKRHYTYGECYVGRRRDTPAVSHARRAVEQRIYQRREKHTAGSGYHRQGGLLGRRELTVHDLALDLQTDGKEKYHHKAVVDDLLDGHPARESALDAMQRIVTGAVKYRQIHVQQIVIYVRRSRQIGQQHGHRDAEYQHDASGPRSFEKVPASLGQNVTVFYPPVLGKHIIIGLVLSYHIRRIDMLQRRAA